MQTTADQAAVGRYYGERQIQVTPDLVEHYANSVRDFNPWYFGDSPFGGPVAPALLVHSEVYRTVDWYLSIFGNLHARQEWELYHPVMVGDTVTARRQVIDRYRKRDREYVVMEVGCYGEDGRLVNRGRTHQSFLLKAEGGTVVDKEREKRSDRRFDAADEAVLETLSGAEKAIDLDMCQLFSPGKSYHNDLEQAKALGFPDVVVQGMMSLCFISEMMTNTFGAGWFSGGRMNVNLVNVVWGGDTVSAGGAVIEDLIEGQRTRANARVWCEKADGTKVVAGTASSIR